MNWSLIVSDLIAEGNTQQELGKKVGCSQGLINDLLHGRRGKRVSYDVGNALVQLHKKIKKQKAAA